MENPFSKKDVKSVLAAAVTAAVLKIGEIVVEKIKNYL